jgi:uncharacterized membrane protein
MIKSDDKRSVKLGLKCSNLECNEKSFQSGMLTGLCVSIFYDTICIHRILIS